MTIEQELHLLIEHNVAYHLSENIKNRWYHNFVFFFDVSASLHWRKLPALWWLTVLPLQIRLRQKWERGLRRLVVGRFLILNRHRMTQFRCVIF